MALLLPTKGFLAIAACLLTLYAIAVCLKTGRGNSKWLWLAFILVGVSKLSVNGTTVQLTFTLLAIQMIPSGAYALGYAPWMIYTSLPVGPIAFLHHLNSRNATNDARADQRTGESAETLPDDEGAQPDSGSI